MTARTQGALAIVELAPNTPGAEAFDRELDGFAIMLRADRRSPATDKGYRTAAASFARSQVARGRSLELDGITRTDIRAWKADLAETGRSQNTIRTYHVALNRFFAYLVGEDVIAKSPMAGMETPGMPEALVPVIPQASIDALLATTNGRSFGDRRDHAVILVLLDTGIRRAELVGISLEDLDLASRLVTVYGKGERTRTVSFGDRTALALQRYLRERARHRRADVSVNLATRPGSTRLGRPLFLSSGQGGHLRLNVDGLWKMIDRRAVEAGIGHVRPHQFRHTWADAMKATGHTDGDVMALGGWRSSQVMARYGAHRAGVRARASYRSPVDGVLADHRNR